MSEKLVIFVLAGSTDLRVVKDEKAYEFKDRKVHERLADRSQPSNIRKTHCDSTRARVPSDLPAVYELYPDKTLWLADEHKPGEVAAVVILNTCRDADFKVNGETIPEPVAVGPVLARWLAEKYSLEGKDATKANDLAIGKSGWLNFLDGKMDAHQPASKAPNRIGLQRIEKVARMLEKSGCRAEFWDGGGIGDFKEPIREMLRLIFVGEDRFRAIHVPEGQRKAQDDLSVDIAEDSYKARQHAIAHIKRGDYQAAYAAASHLAESPDEARWLNPLHAAALFFAGQPVQAACTSPALTRLCELEAKHYFVSAALRVESSLKSGFTVEALLATFAFFDAIFIQTVRKVLGLQIDTNTPWPGNLTEDELKKLDGSWFKASGIAIGKLDTSLFKQFGKTETIGNVGERLRNWVANQKFNPVGAPVVALYTALYKGELKDHRNLAAHSRLSTSDAKAMKDAMITQNIWSSSNSPFLKCELVARAIAIHETSNLADAFLALETELIDTLRNHEIKP